MVQDPIPSLTMATLPAASNSLPITAKFNPLYRPYLVVTIGLSMVISIIGIPLAIIWFCGVGQWWAGHYFHKLLCELSDKTLRFRKGILFQVEKTIPLENIQDVTFIEGPILKRYNLATLKFETAGHSLGQAHDMQLTGIIDAHEFRNRILEAREHLRAQARGTSPQASSDDQVLVALNRIAARLDEITGLMRDKGNGT